MPETINWSVTFDAVLGPRIAEAGTLAVGAYDKVSVQLPAAKTDAVEVEVQPSSGAGEVQLLVITASSYEAPEATYSPDSPDPDADPIPIPFTLDGPVVLIGAGAVRLLSELPKTLWFTNPGTDPVDIEILVGRQP
jgi:hypothetical protein